jgi:PTH1 family peptidyl-tRNA hydrolase
MNNSGIAVNYIVKKYDIDSSDIFVVYDDLDLPFGKIRIRMGGAAGGHRGAESIINTLGTDIFLRIRLGIGRPTRHEGSQRDKSTISVDDYVLSYFSPSDKGKVRTMTKEAIRTIKLLVKDGIDVYMSKYNRK